MTATDLFWQELGGTLFEEAGDALFLFDPESEQIRDANPMSQRLSGFTRRELLQSNITSLIRSENDGGMQRMRLAYRRTGVFHSQEGFLLRHKNAGLWVPVNLTITRLHTESQTVGLLTARDITERREAMARLYDSEQRHRMLLEQLPAIVWTTDAELRILSNAGTGLAGIGEKPNDKVGKTMAEALGSNDPNFLPMAAHIRALAGEKVTYEMEWKGRAWQTIIEPMRGADGAIIGTIGMCLDCTERKKADEALRASEATYRTLIDNLEQSIFLKDRDLRFIAVNPPFCRSFGKSAEEIMGKDDFYISPAQLAEKYRSDDRKVMQDRKRVEVEEQTLLHGKLRTVQTIKTPILDDKGEAVGVLGIFWDVTEQRNLEAQLRQAHKMEAVGQLAGGIAHDFNNLLTGIIGNLALVLADLPESHPSRELLSNAETAAVRAAELTRQLLGFSRRTPLLSRPLNLNAVLDETLRLIQRTFDPRIEVRVSCQPDLWAIQADASQMGQVLMNLCLNARDAMPQGGVLTLRTANVEINAAMAAKSIEGRAGRFVRLHVEDTGIGMAPEVHERIFEPFFTTKEQGKGTGLGLAMVFGILKQHHGWIECQSELNRGTTFAIYLPAMSAIPVQGPAVLPDGIQGGRETILLADDEEVVSRLGETILRRHGYRVLMAADGAEAVEIYRRQPHTIDLVILDLSMPRLSGSETLRELRQINPGVRVLISSGYSSDENLRAVEREGVLGFVAKPYRPAEFARQVRAALDEKK
jgi:PAS domain S-box-containing protein